MKDKLFGLAWLVGAASCSLARSPSRALLNVPPTCRPPGVDRYRPRGRARLVPLDDRVRLRLAVWSGALPRRGRGRGQVFEVLKALGSIYVPQPVASSSALYGSIGAVFAILAWLFFFGGLLVYRP